jgi:hypothetical protein
MPDGGHEHTRSPIHVRRSIWDGFIIGITMAVVLVAAVWLVVVLSGDPQRAIACELTLPITEQGRDEAVSNSRCLIPNGLDPIDSNLNGMVEVEPGADEDG